MKARRAAGGHLLLLLLLLHVLLFPALGKKRSVDGPIKTVVIVVQENRSFDHMLGWLKRLNPDIDGVTGDEWNLLNVSIPDSPRLYFTDDSEFVDPDPGHSFQAMREQIFGSEDTSARPPPMNGFAQQAESMEKGFSKKVMGGFRPEVVPVHTALALEYAVFDKWFASVPASTQPNRFYIHSATSHGAMSNNRQDLIDGFPQKTIMELVDEAGLSFGVYYQNIPATLFFKSMRQLKYITNFHEYSLKFKLHAKLGLLPNYVVIEQRYFDSKLLPANDDHPSHDVSEGQTFLKEVYEILRSSPQWKDMLLLITYDEHGGFFDHVPTPTDDIPNPDGLIGPDPYFFKFDRLGVRVPTIMVSPWINKGTVVHDAVGPFPSSRYEHSSIAATVRKLFNLGGPLTDRDAWAGTFENIFRDTVRTDCPDTLPSPPWSLRHSAANEEAKLTEFQEEMVQLASQLNGDHTLDTYPNIGKLLKVGQANNYVQEAMARFVEVGRMQLLQGGNATDIVRVAPSPVQVTARQPDFLRSSKVQSYRRRQIQ